MNPGIGDGIRGLDADAREKMFDDAVQTTYDKSRENQDTDKAGGDKAEADAMVLRRRTGRPPPSASCSCSRPSTSPTRACRGWFKE